ncbi:MAG: PadR family transcriptional regulator [Candidatus Bathyarchaeota archaeon]|nr:PadR family transcriptional regulator [Candidatus Bathyarchaeota archaeon]
MTDKDVFDAESIKAEFTRRLVSNLLDIILLAHFKEEPFSGYDATQYLHRSLNVLMSPGTVYANLYSMERHGLVESFRGPNKTLFKATAKGIFTKDLLTSPMEIAGFFSRIMEQ